MTHRIQQFRRNLPHPTTSVCALLLCVLFVAPLNGQDQSKSDDKAQNKTQPKQRLDEIGPKPNPITPPTDNQIVLAMRNGVDFLLKIQNKDSSWGSHHLTKGLNIYAPVPGSHRAFRYAVTALCISAITESLDAVTDAKRPRVIEALERGENYLLEHLPKLRRATPDAIYNVWAHGYGISALVHMRKRLPDDKKRTDRIDKVIESQFDMLTRYESVNGGWGYYDFRNVAQKPGNPSSSFTSATVLIAFKEAKNAGIDPPSRLIERATAALKRQRNTDGSFLYGEYMKYRPAYAINRPGGSLGRSQACNLALRIWGDKVVSDKVLETWLDRLYARNLWLDIGRKRPIPHESYFAVAGYFYYYGHYYAAHCIDQLPVDRRPHFQSHLAHLILPKQEKDGSWWDYPFYNYHQQYGTAMAIMTLKRCRKTKP